MPLWSLPQNIFEFAALIVPTLSLRLTVQIRKLKYKMKLLVDDTLKCKSSLKQVFLFCLQQTSFVRS